MKKIKFLLLVMLSVFVLSCIKDSDQGGPNSSNTSSELKGTWLEIVDGADYCPEKMTIGASTIDVVEYYGESCELMEDYTVAYTRSGNTIMIDSEAAQIVLLNSTTLAIQFTYTEGTQTFTETYTYTRQ